MQCGRFFPLASSENHVHEYGRKLALNPRRCRPICHVCGKPGTIHAHTRKFIRVLSFGDFTIMLQVEHRKIRCHHCRKVRVEGLEFVDAGARITHCLTAYAAQLCKAGLGVEVVARHLDLDPKTVKAIDKAALEAEFGQTTYDGLKRLAIDEIAFKKGHQYMTVVLDCDTGRAVWMGEGRQTTTIYWLKDMLTNIWDYDCPGWT